MSNLITVITFCLKIKMFSLYSTLCSYSLVYRLDRLMLVDVCIADDSDMQNYNL